jgi:hypothetical protein
MSSQENMLTIILIKSLNSMHRQSGLWVPEQGLFWERDLSTEDGDEESTDGSSFDDSGSNDSSSRLEDE